LLKKYAPWYIKPIIHLDIVWRIIKQFIKLFIPSKRIWVKPTLLGIKDFYLNKKVNMKIGIEAYTLERNRTGVGRVLINILRQWDNF